MDGSTTASEVEVITLRVKKFHRMLDKNFLSSCQAFAVDEDGRNRKSASEQVKDPD